MDVCSAREARKLEQTAAREAEERAAALQQGDKHAAIEALRNAPSGVYCGPLRLLAWEVHDKLSSGGLACTLRTGQETREVLGAAHTACTDYAPLGARTATC